MDMSAPRPSSPDHRRGVTVLGSTGSVGVNTVDLLARDRDRFRVEALTGNRNVALLAEQARLLSARLAVVADAGCYHALKEALFGTGIEVAAGRDAVIEAASRPAEVVMASIVGAAGLAPALAAVRRGAILGLANKECLVSAGDIMVAEVARHGARILPVDSEHSAIYQVFEFENARQVRSVVLTASGGPFREMEREAMAKVSPAQAVAHPNWSMGAKISVDSATMMNKGLELIEAFHLFPVDREQIEIVVHPQSVIHGLVTYTDGSVLAQLGAPDMRTPIAVALAWPERMAAPVAKLDLAEIGRLTFEAPDEDRFPALRLARAALAAGGSAPTVLNAANEIAVHGFLAGRLGFLEIARVVEDTLAAIPTRPLETLADVADIDSAAREIAATFVSRSAPRAVSAG
ncbi:MAG: 1-deoxy-D-xylulose-5-phosphate reductoisomerase [Rhodospirillales bacterium]|nr:MAG: 1-deoxy-D-xylulose-5-phosphate reductoisomerase [Rhodospirillales bacterium]